MSSVALRTALFGSRPDGSILNLNFAQGGYSYLGGNTSLSSLPIWSYSGSVSGTGATFRTALNSSSTVINFTNGIPRITDLGLLVEAAATNLLTFSQAFASWTLAGGATITSGATAAPDGTTTADLWNGVGTLTSNAPAVSASTAYAGSVYVKTAGATTLDVTLQNRPAFAQTVTARVNPATGAITSSGGNSSVVAVDTLTNGWFRIRAVGTSNVGSTSQVFIINLANGGLYVWGAGMEQSAFASSYIPTTSAAVTRAADVASIGGLTLAAPYAILVKGTLPATRIGGFPALASITASIGSAGPFVNGTSGQPGANMGAGTFNQSIGSAVAVGGTVNVGFLADLNTGSGVVNGSAPVVTSGTFTPSVGAASFNIGISSNAGGNAWNGYITRFIYWAAPPSISALQAMSGQ